MKAKKPLREPCRVFLLLRFRCLLLRRPFLFQATQRKCLRAHEQEVFHQAARAAADMFGKSFLTHRDAGSERRLIPREYAIVIVLPRSSLLSLKDRGCLASALLLILLSLTL